MSTSSVNNVWQKAKSLWQQEPVPFITFYALTGLVSVLIPAITYRRAVKQYQSSYNYYQQQYENNNQEEDEHYEIDVNNCKWWKFWCTSLWINENGEYVDQNENDQNNNDNYNGNNNNNNNNNYNPYGIPSWFSGWGNSNRSGDRGGGGASGDRNNANSGALHFVYAWQLLLFVALVVYGSLVIFKFRSTLPHSKMALQSLWLLVFVWMNTSFLTMWLLANGSIYTEGREIEEMGGFYNQFSVLVFLSNFWYTMWSLLVCIALSVRICRTSSNKIEENGSVYASNNRAMSSTSYLPYTEPSVTVTGVSDRNLGASDAAATTKRGSWLGW